MSSAARDVSKASRTAEETLARKSAEPDVISGAHLVAKTLGNEEVDTIFIPGGGHIIDFCDGCLDEDIRGDVATVSAQAAQPRAPGNWMDPDEIGPALVRAREAVRSSGKSAVVNIWVDPNEFAPGTKSQTMYE